MDPYDYQLTEKRNGFIKKYKQHNFLENLHGVKSQQTIYLINRYRESLSNYLCPETRQIQDHLNPGITKLNLSAPRETNHISYFEVYGLVYFEVIFKGRMSSFKK